MTELIWEGKYKDEKKVSPVKIALPFQTIETVNESVQERQRTLDLFSLGQQTDWRNRLIWGDKKYVLPSLLPEFSGKVNLIYIDPPFDTGADFSFTATIPDNPETEENEATDFIKQPSILEQKAYRDTWANYLQWTYETIAILYELLADNGSIYVHLDNRQCHNVKLIMDEIFGSDNFRNHIAWKRTNAHGNAEYQFGQVYDSILFFAKSDSTKINSMFQEYDKDYVENFFKHVEPNTGRRYRSQNLTNYNKNRPNLTYEWKGHKRTWLFSKEKMVELDKQGKILYSSTGFPSMKQYLDESHGVPMGDFWQDLRALKHGGDERMGYDTQKPEALLERVIKTSSNEGDLVLDCFCGSGTTPAVAEKLNRRWIACDLGRFAIHTARKRLLQIPNVKPFVVQNLGKYERQQWQVAEFSEAQTAQEKDLRYRKFILELYRAEPITSSTWLHGIKSGRMVHVGTVDAPVTMSDVKAISAEVWKSVGKGKDSARKAAVDILGWEFAFDLNESAKQMATELKVDVSFKKIPREVLEKKAVDQGEIKFFELASLSIKKELKKKELTITLSDFIVPPDDVPEDVQKAISHWSQWIDYWAVDWSFKGDTFHNEWQSFRTRKDSKLELSATHTYESAGEYDVLVKVIDILGNDTTKILKATIK